MRAERHAMFKSRGDCFTHRRRVATMKPAGDVGRGNVGQNFLVVAHFPGAKAFAHIAIQINT